MAFFKRCVLVISMLWMVPLLAACSQPRMAQSAPEENPAGGPTAVVVRILNLDYVLTVTPAPSPVPASPTAPQRSPTPAGALIAAQPSQAAPEASATPACTNQAELVAHLSISPNTAVKAGQLFAKIWQIRNVGNCTWDESYSLVFVDGERMEAPDTAPLGGIVKPGETLDLRINMISPIFPGGYTSSWLLQDGNGNRFGLGPDYGQPIQVVIAVQPQPAATSG